MNTFEDLLRAIEAYSDAKADYKRVKEGGQDSYYLHYERSKLDFAKNTLELALAAHIKEVIRWVEVKGAQEDK